MDEVALGDQYQSVVSTEVGEHLGDAVEEPHRLHQHAHPEGHNVADDPRRDAALGDGDGALDHRQRERLDAVAGDRQVALLRGAQGAPDVDAVGDVRREQVDVTALDVVEGVLAVPQRVVGVEPDDVELFIAFPGHAAVADSGHRVIALR